MVSSMIHSIRPTVPPVAITIFIWKLFCNTRFCTDRMCENSDQYQLWLWRVGRVDQFYRNRLTFWEMLRIKTIRPFSSEIYNGSISVFCTFCFGISSQLFWSLSKNTLEATIFFSFKRITTVFLIMDLAIYFTGCLWILKYNDHVFWNINPITEVPWISIICYCTVQICKSKV